MFNTDFVVRNNQTSEVVFFDTLSESLTQARTLGNASVFAFHNDGVKIRHSYEVKNNRAYRINKVI
jgi:hypothetical protein